MSYKIFGTIAQLFNDYSQIYLFTQIFKKSHNIDQKTKAHIKS